MSDGASIVEKGAMSWYAAARGVPSLIFPRGGAVIDECTKSGNVELCKVFYENHDIIVSARLGNGLQFIK